MTNTLLRFNKRLKYVVFDFETEGLNLRYSKPWQLGFIVVESGKITQEHDLLIDVEGLKLSKGALKTTGFNQAIYDRKKQDKHKVLEIFDSFVYNPEYLLVGHNVLNYDVYIHNNLRLLCGKKSDYSYIERIVDTICLSKAYRLGIKNAESNNLCLWQYKLASYRKRNMKTSAQAMLNELNIDFEADKLHDAMYDVKMTNEIFKKLIWNVEV